MKLFFRLFTLPLVGALLLSPLAKAGMDLPLFSMMSPFSYSFRYSGSLQPRTTASDSSPAIGIHQENLSANLLLWKNETDKVTLSPQLSMLDLFSDSGDPTDFYDISIGSTYTHTIEPGKSYGANLSFGSASDKPFKDSDVNTVGATAFYSTASSPTSNWFLFLNYSNHRPILNGIPLPGFAYSYFPLKEFRMTLGVPFAAIFWQFADRWSVNLLTVVPWVVKTTLNYKIAGPIQAYVNFDFSQQTYLRYGRTDSKEQVFFDEKRATLGLKSPLSAVLLAELEGGYAFDRRLFDAESYRGERSNEIPFGSGALMRLSLSAGF